MRRAPSAEPARDPRDDIGGFFGIGNEGRRGFDDIVIQLRQYAFLWTSGATDGVAANPQMKDLGVLAGQDTSNAYGINNAGDVVGTTSLLGGNFRAFVTAVGTSDPPARC